MSRTQQRWAFVLILIFTVVLAACQPSATPTPSPRPPTEAPATTAPVAEASEEVTEAAPALETAVPTEEMMASEEAPTEEVAVVPTSELTLEATEAVEVAILPTEEMSVEATEEVAVVPTSEVTLEPTAEVTVEATPELGSVIEVAQQAGDFTTLLAAVDEAGLTDTLEGDGPFTIFAPTDAAFQKLLDDSDMTADELLAREDLADILQHHVVAGKVTSDDLETYRSTDNPDEIVVPTLNGESLTLTEDDGTWTVNGVATVTLMDVEAANGVIYVIDTVLMPPSAEATVEASMDMTPTEEVTIEVPVLPTAEVTAEVMATAAPVVEATSEAGSVASGAAVMVASGEDVVIGLAVGLSGEGIAPLGIDIQRGAELALADRPTVTVDGQTFNVSLDVQDDQCSAEGGQAVANRFASDGSIVGVVGPMCSSACRAAAPILDAATYTSISPSCTAPDLTSSSYTSFNRSVVSDAFQGAIAADYIYNVLGVRRIATIHDGSTYGEGLVNVVTQNFEALGGEVVASDAVAVGDTDFRGLLDDIAQEDPELIYFGGFPAEAARLIQQRADAGLEDVTFFGADGINGTEVVNLAGEDAEGIYATKAIPASSQALSDFLDRYISTYGEEPPAPYNATGYDAVNILLDAVEAVGTVDENGDLVVDRAAVQEYVRSFSDFQGLTGVLNADGTGETSVADIGIYEVQDGTFVQLSTGNMVDGSVVLTPVEESAAPTEEASTEATEAAPMEMTPEVTAES